MASISISKTTTFDLVQSKEFDPKAKLKIHAKAHAKLKNHEYAKSPIPQVGSTLNAVAKAFDKCYIKQFTPENSPLGVLSILLVKYMDVRGKFSFEQDEILYTPHRALPPEGIPIIRQTYFDDPLTAFRRFRARMIQADIHPDLLKIFVAPWAEAQKIKLKTNSPTSIILNGKIHTIFLHAMIILRTSMRKKKDEIYAGHPADQCYFVSSRELPRFLTYIDNVAESYLDRQTNLVDDVTSRPTMKQFYKREFMTNLAVFGSFALCFLVYLIYPRFGWWNAILVLMGFGAGAVMGGLFGHLSYLSHQKKREVIAEGFRDLRPVSRKIIREGLSCDLFQKTFLAEFPFDEADIAPIQEIESSLEMESVIEQNEDEIDLFLGGRIPFMTRFRSLVNPFIQSVKQHLGKIINGIGIWIRKMYRRLVSVLRNMGFKIKAGYQKIIISLKARRTTLNSPPENIPEPDTEIKKNTEKPKSKPKTKAKPKAKLFQPPESQSEPNPTDYKSQKLQAFFSE
jgi:hypothetical protein